MRNLKLALFTWTLILISPISSASLDQFYSKTGRVSISVDGAGSNAASHVAEVEKPNASATVSAAFVMASNTQSGSITDTSITIDGTAISWDANIIANGFNNVRADVTSLVKSKIDAAAPGRIAFTFTENGTNTIDGETLVVVFDDPTQTSVKTIALFFGGQESSGDSFSVTLVTPIDPAASGAVADFGLGIGFGAQGSMHSTIDINGTRISSSAGGQDDGSLANGALITVGGLDDSNENPADPNALPNGDTRIDDELYTLLPHITNTTSNILVETANPSNDDDIYFSYLVLSSVAIVGDGIALVPETSSANTGSDATITATVVDGSGTPISGATVSFNVSSGPNSGSTFTATSDADGKASITYSSTAAGTDQISATSPAVSSVSNLVSVVWSDDDGPVIPPVIPVEAKPIPTLGEWGLLLMTLLLGMVVIREQRLHKKS